jgi:hypothetical protein
MKNAPWMDGLLTAMCSSAGKLHFDSQNSSLQHLVHVHKYIPKRLWNWGLGLKSTVFGLVFPGTV